MRRGSRVVGLLWRWHRRLGLLAAVFVLLLAGSGIVLNHSSALGLDRSLVDWPWLNAAYGDNSAVLPAYQLGAHWLSRTANGKLYFDAREVAPCEGRLVGAVQAGELLYAGCGQELLVITGGGELVESVTASTGLPVPLEAVGLVDDRLALLAGQGWRLADIDLMEFSARAAPGATISQQVAGQLPDEIRKKIPAPDRWLSWERVLLDLHSGRIVGRAGVLWVDVVGVLLFSLAMSGIAMWWLHRRRHFRSGAR